MFDFLFHPPKGKLGKLFNDYERAFCDATEPTDQEIDLTVTVHMHLFGDQRRLVAALRRAHPEIPIPDNVYYLNISANPVEIWGVCRQTRESYGGEKKLCYNHLSYGHEHQHADRVTLSGWTLNGEDPSADGCRILSPDRYAEL